MIRIGLRPDDMTALRADMSVRFEPRLRLYGIGMGKTGTNALASLFTGVLADHEPEADRLIEALLDYERGRSDWRALRDFVVDRDRRLGLTVDVSNLNVFLVDLLLELDPGAKFVLTIRDPWSWLDSIVNHYLRRPPTEQWRAFADHRFGRSGDPHPAEETALADAGPYPLAGYLGYWRAHMAKALDTVPADRLLVVRTERIVAEAARIAEFGGLPAARVDRSAIHEYRNPAKRPILQEISREHLDEQVRLHCEPLLSQFFPECRGAADAVADPPGASPPVVDLELRATLLAEPPRFHFWDGQWQGGGLAAEHLELIERTIATGGAAGGVAYETGAGLSTVWLLALGMREVRSFCIKSDVCQRIDAFLESYPDARARWHFHVGPAEVTLPADALATAEPTVDFCLIDGGHGLTNVFTDFVYLNYVLKPGGILAIDDLQLGSCRLLAHLLIEPRMGFTLVGRSPKLALLRKDTDRRLLGDFGWQKPLLDRLAADLGDLP